MLRALGVIALLAVLCGCTPAATATPPDAGASRELSFITVSGEQRSYLVRVPEAALDPTQLSGPMPLVIAFHGAGGNAARMEASSGLTVLAEVGDAIVVYPNGTAANEVAGELAWNAGECCGLPRDTGVDDVSFVLALIAELEAQYSIDASRIYLAGFSNGGMLSYRLACEHAELFSAIAVVGAALNVAPCAPAQPLSVLIIHGTADATVPYNGGESNERTAARFGQWRNTSVSYATSLWRDTLNCGLDAVVTDDGTAQTETYRDCDRGTALEVVTIPGGTHSWPRADTAGVDASELIVEFFTLP